MPLRVISSYQTERRQPKWHVLLQCLVLEGYNAENCTEFLMKYFCDISARLVWTRILCRKSSWRCPKMFCEIIFQKVLHCCLRNIYSHWNIAIFSHCQVTMTADLASPKRVRGLHWPFHCTWASKNELPKRMYIHSGEAIKT